MLYNFHLNADMFYKVQSHSKTVECRVNDSRHSVLRQNDIICFRNRENEDEFVIAIVHEVHHFSSFLELFTKIPVVDCGFDISTTAEDAAKYMHHYYTEAEQSLGSVAIVFSLK